MAGGEEKTSSSSSSSSVLSLQDTPTWAVATVCFGFIAISITLERFIQLLCSWLKKHRKKALIEAAEKLKSELMLLGFISLFLAVAQRSISNICIPSKVAGKMLPCRNLHTTLGEGNTSAANHDDQDHCSSKGMVSLISQEGIHQLHIFIFVLAVMHVLYSTLTMALGRAKMKRWSEWEKDTRTTEYQASNDPSRFRYTRDTTFGRRHMNAFTKTSLHLWIKCFFRQFFHSVAKVDYLTLRHAFIATHLSQNNSFNFQKYIERSLEDDFKAVVGISPPLWFVVVIFLLFDVHGWNVYLWVSLIPLVIVLLLGAKLEIIIARMALQLKDQSTVIKGAPLVQPNDELFWFGHPRFLLHFLHLTLFLNAFEIAFFIWITYEFGIKSCYHENIELIVTRVVIAVCVQVLCSYITLPLYALVTQMGSQYKSAVLEEQVTKALKEWHESVKYNRKKRQGKENPQQQSHNNSSPTDHPHQVEEIVNRTNSPKASTTSSSSPLYFPNPSLKLGEDEIVPVPCTEEISSKQHDIIEDGSRYVKYRL